jgi:hypothetical protein
MSRHYSDVAALSQHSAGQAAAADFQLLARVRLHKHTYFRSAWGRYDTAVPGSLRLLPAEQRRAEVQRDYTRMADMFMITPPSFETIMAQLEKLEKQINTA